MKARWPRLVLLIALALSACQPAQGGESTPSSQTTKTHKAAATPDALPSRLGVRQEALRGLTVEVWHPWFGVEASLFESQAEEFNKTNEWGIVVQPSSQINYSLMYESVTASLPTPRRPDVVIAFPEHALAWDVEGYVVDLTKYVDDPLYGWSEAEVKDFPSIFWTQDEAGKRRLGIPAQRSARFLFYDQGWARQLGFDAAPRTAEEFRQQACKAHGSMLADPARDNDAMGGWLVDTQPMTALSWLTAFGGGVLEGNDYRFLTPKNIAALRFVKGLYDEGCAWTAQPEADPSTGSGQRRAAAFAGRTALFATGSLEDLAEQSRAFASAGNADEWTVLAFPGEEQSGLVVYGSSYIVLKSSPEEQLASWLFVRWMLSPQNQAKWVETTGLFPLRASSLDLLGDYRDSHPQWAAALALLPQGQIQPQLASWRKVRVMLGDGFDYMFRINLPAGQVAAILAQMESTSRDLSK